MKIAIKITNDDNSSHTYEIDEELLSRKELRIMLKEKIQEYEDKEQEEYFQSIRA